WVFIGPDGLYLIEAWLVHAAVVSECQSFLGIESIAKGSIGIPVDEPALRAGIGVEIPLIKPCKADAGTGRHSPFLRYQRIVEAARVGKDVELIVVTV